MDDFAAGARDRRVRTGPPSRSPRLLASLVGLVLSAAALRAQDGADQPLRLQGPTPAGARISVTESWGTLQFTVVNPNPSGRDARVTVFYPDRPDVQYARDVWVPGRSSLTSWLTVGPAPRQGGKFGREMQMVLHDRTGGTSRVVLPPGEERVRSRAVPYQPREQTTTLMADLEAPEPGQPEAVLPPELFTLARLPRATSHSPHISVVNDGPMPLAPEALDGIDVFVLAGNRLAADPPGRAALRRWVQEGGRLWVMLDRVDPGVVAPILGEDAGIAVVDRVGLTTLNLQALGIGPTPEPVREVEQPVPFVRVVPSAADRVIASANGWPAAFVRRVGRGKVLFTTLGARGWSRPRATRDGRSPYPELRDFPVPLHPVTVLTAELHPPPGPDPLPPDVFQPMLAEEIGYSVVGRGTAALILGGFVLALAGVGLGLRSRRPALVAGLVPLAAAAAVVVFVGLSERSRRAVPPTVGLAAMVDPVSGTDESVVSGLFAVYHPSSGPVRLGTREGAVLGLDAEGLEGQTRLRVQADTDAWHWDGLALPAGARTGSFRATLKTGRVAAVARFGPDGIEGKLDAGRFGGLADAVVTTQTREPLAVRLGPEGAFGCGSADALPAGQYLPGAVLSDRQQRRQEVYRHIHAGPALRHLEGRDVLLAWANVPDVPIMREEGARVVGSVLLAVPLEFERPPAGSRVTVPRGVIPFKRVTEAGTIPATLSAPYPVSMRLRFQLPDSVLPLTVERATLFAQPRMPFHRLSVAGVRDGRPVPLFAADGPVEPVRIDVTDPSLLRPDEQGGLYLEVAVGAPPAGAPGDGAWKIESLALEVVGRTAQAP